MSHDLSMQSLLACLPVGDDAKTDVLVRVSDPARTYHGISHLAFLWECHVRHADTAAFDDCGSSRLIACAIAYHDLVYDASRRDNEARSAKAWREVAARSQVAKANADWVAKSIIATRDHLGYVAASDVSPADDKLRVWFLDLDLAPLGAPPATFRRNARRLRLESPHLSDAEWASGNLAFLRKIEAAPRIFRSSALHRAYETRARANIAAAIARQGRA